MGVEHTASRWIPSALQRFQHFFNSVKDLHIPANHGLPIDLAWFIVELYTV